jgi:hypothetical protein
MNSPYLITFWDGIPLEFFSEERIKEAVDCGFTLIQGGKVGGYKENNKKDEAYDVATSQKALELCEKYGVKYTVFDRRVMELLNGDQGDEEIDLTVRKVCEDYKNYPALYSYLVHDEPGALLFPRLKKIVNAFRRHDPLHIPYINLFPNYASQAQLGVEDYSAYVKQFVEAISPEILCYDHYHFFKNVGAFDAFTDDPDSFEAKVYAASLARNEKCGFYNNLEIIRDHGLKNNIPYVLIVLLAEHGPYRDLTKEELLFEVWQSLAYGCSMLSYYSYWELPRHCGYSNAIISAEGERCRHYWDVQEINRRISPIGKRIALTRSEKVFHVGDKYLKEGVTLFTPYRSIEGIIGKDLTVGFFEDGTLIIANQDHASPASVTVNAKTPLEIFDEGLEAFIPLNSNEFSIPAGEGVYLKMI